MSENPDQKPDLRLVTSSKGGAPIVPGNPGNSGGKKGRSGRLPSAVREACLLAFDQRIKILKQIADGKAVQVVKMPNGEETQALMSADVSERLKALDLLGKYGGLTHTTNETTVKRPHREAVEKVRRGLGLAS